jgi:hypothetical protein
MKNICKPSAKITFEIKFDVAFCIIMHDDKHIFDRCRKEIWDPVEDGFLGILTPMRRIYRNNNIHHNIHLK